MQIKIYEIRNYKYNCVHLCYNSYQMARVEDILDWMVPEQGLGFIFIVAMDKYKLGELH